jgi:hypothetical protein
MASNFLLKKGSKLAAIIDPKLPFIEIGALVILIIAELTKGSNNELSTILILISISFLSVLYFFNSYRIVEENKDSYKIFLVKLTGWANSASLMGILFSINHYVGGRQMLIVGLLTQLLILGFTFGRKYIKKVNSLRKIDIIRSVVLTLLVAAVYFLSGY